ncbi:sodium/proline symporter [Psittacicella hinzii]|uniref:Sodium/proline symporter n=1 Tax=Psittacicella hinzii TaxID=2028575 RepID=A0A3A1Y6X9_9GAMM|nr:sodium/proline symporter PutP [Psittacicella hinzii]RIY34002.1 sodium/proline symporter [Psittacicella hinzii]
MLNLEIYISFGLYLLIILGVGVFAYFSTRNYDDYVLGGRKMGGFVTAMSAGATDMSGWLLLGLPGAIYMFGLSQAWIAIGLTLGAYFNYRIVAGRLRTFTEHYNNALTLPEFFAARFPNKAKTLKLLSSTIILFFFTIYCASGVVAGAKLFQSLLGMDYSTALVAGALATIIYTFIGGYLAVSWSDCIQATLMIFALVLAPVVILLHFSWGDITQALADKTSVTNIPYSNMLFNISGLGVISSLAWGLGYFGQPHILVRFMASDSVQSINKARTIGIIWMILCLGGACAVGYFGLAYFTLQGIEVPSETIFIELAKAIFNPWVVGIVLSAILAAVMSTLSAQFLMCSTVLTEDFYHGFIRKNASDRELLWFGRLMILVVALGAIYIARDPNSSVMDLVVYAWAGFGSSFGPLIILSLYSRSISCNGALAGMLVGALTVILWSPVMEFLGWHDIASLNEMVPAFILSAFVTLLSSIFSKVDNDIAVRFDKAAEDYQALKDK